MTDPADRWDLLDPALHATGEADGALDELRAHAPVARCPGRRGPGYWAVTGYPELVAIARDTATFTSWYGTRPEVRRAAGALRPLHNLDGAAHAALRKLAMRLVAPPRIGALAPGIADLAGAAIDAFDGGDAMASFVVPVVARVFCAWLGVPPTQAAELAARVEAVHTAGAALLDALADPVRQATARQASAGLATMMGTLLTSRPDAPSAAPGGALDEIATMVTTGELDPTAATMLACLLVEAGLPTTIDALGNALATITSRPVDLDAAIDEVLRTASPIQQFARYATADVVVGDMTIAAGEQVVLWFGAANRDPRRGASGHVAFGAGPHRCLGAMFAREILRGVLGAWFARVPQHTAHGERRASSYLWGYASLQITI